jgi:hypothetical protein
LKELKGLWHLDISYTAVTDGGLAELRELKSLRTLRLIGAGTTEAGRGKLAEALPLVSLVVEEVDPFEGHYWWHHPPFLR